MGRLASPYEVIALLIYAYLVALGFKLQSFDKDKKLRKYPFHAHHVLANTKAAVECESLAPRLPPQWNSGFGSCSFLYSNKQSAMAFSIRVNPIGQRIEIQGQAVGDNNICRFERPIGEVVKSEKLPVHFTIKDHEENRSNIAEKLQGVFTSKQAIAGMFPLLHAFF
jgi:hypothetical protein